jgi:hypothetical protein
MAIKFRIPAGRRTRSDMTQPEAALIEEYVSSFGGGTWHRYLARDGRTLSVEATYPGDPSPRSRAETARIAARSFARYRR